MLIHMMAHFEEEMFEYLEEKGWKGLVLLDDIATIFQKLKTSGIELHFLKLT